MSTNKRNTESLGISEVLKELLVQKDKLKKGLEAIEVKKAWENLMGKNINAYTKEVVLKNNILYIWLSSSVLREELIYGKQKIIKMLNEEAGTLIIKDLIIK